MDGTNYQEWTDEELIHACARRDHQAFETLYKRFEKKVFNFLCMKTDNTTLAEEIMVDVMVAVWKGAKNFQGTSKVSTWIIGIAKNQAMKAIRGQIRTNTTSVNLEDIQETPDTADNPATQVERKSTGALVQKAIHTLPPDQQEIIYFGFYKEMPYQEIAELLNIPVNTVKTRVFYAKKNLHKALEQFDSQPGCL
jgi:RNA polymerase sigma-70 factor (ECF subfamily)